MKKKLFILVLAVSAACVCFFANNDVFAGKECIVNVSNSGQTGTSARACATAIHIAHPTMMTLSPCDGSDVNSCKNDRITIHVTYTCSLSGGDAACDSQERTYLNNVYNYLVSGDLDPCSNVQQAGASCKCADDHWSYYASSKQDCLCKYRGQPGDCPTNPSGGGSGGGGGGSSSSNPDSGDDSGSSTEPIDPSPVSEGACTSILPNAWCTGDDGIQQIIRLIIAILTGSIVVAGTIGLVICGVLWMTARENEQQVTTAKKRMLDIVIGVVAWVLLALLANLFIPKPSSEIDGTSVVTSKEKIVWKKDWLPFL